jgi:8-oxo-dGTP pyrophosphatase MutT (NUDIX family)
MIFTEKPEAFNPRFEVACCHVCHDGKLLMLHRADHKSAGNKWGMPAGKIDQGESSLEAARRETLEETGIDIPLDQISFQKTFYVRYPDYDFVYHIFQVELEKEENVSIREEEHKDFRWMTPQEALSLMEDLVPDEDACIRFIYGVEKEKQEGFAEGKIRR